MKEIKMYWGIFLIVLLVNFLFALSFASQATAQKIKTEDGVKIILNGKTPKPPKGVPTKIRLEEDLTIGLGDDPDQSFSEVTAFVVDDGGTIYALDFKDRKVKVFDSSGTFLRLIGKKGQGPGEVDTPSGIILTPEKNLAIEDATTKRLACFTREGEFIENVSFADKMGLVNIFMDCQGNFLAREIGMAGSEMFFEIKKYDRAFKPLFAIDKIEFPIPVPGTKMNIMDMMAIYQLDGEANIYYGRNREYEIKVFDPEGKPLRTIRREYDRVKITEEDIEKMLARIPSVGPVNIKEMFEFPKHFSPFQYLTLDEERRLFVRTWEKGRTEDEFAVDVFDSEGRFIAKFVTKADIRLWKNNKMYAMEETDEGFRVIKRFHVSWEK